MTPENDISTEVMQTEGGKIVFAPDVIATIAGLAAADVKGVTSMTKTAMEGLTEIFGKKNMTKGVKVEVGSEEVAVEISLIIEYGYRIHEVCQKVQEEVKSAIETMTGLRVIRVNVYVQAINIVEQPEPTLLDANNHEPKPE